MKIDPVVALREEYDRGPRRARIVGTHLRAKPRLFPRVLPKARQQRGHRARTVPM